MKKLIIKDLKGINILYVLGGVVVAIQWGVGFGILFALALLLSADEAD